MRHQRSYRSLWSSTAVLALVASTALACSSDVENGTGTGGTVSNGGTPSTGGTTSAGGSSSSGGTVSTGGNTSAGGARSAGGSTGTGGSTGGTSSTGGTTSSGGTPSTGGASSGGASSGGTAAGGVTNTGGAANTGGAPSAGGAPSTGGSAGAAGSDAAGVKGEPIGFATLNGGTTGGKAGQTVTASTYAELKTYAESATPYVILVSGTISNGANGGVINVKANKSLVGVGSAAFLSGIGLNIANSNNIIVQNLRISLVGVTTRTDTSGVFSGGRIVLNDGDAISISGTSKNLWIDHCELFSEDPSVQTNKDLYDGLIDIKGDTGFITISRCYLHDHHKGGLVGAADDDVFPNRKVTFHHNHYNNVKLRVPMYRGAVGHFFNNYIVKATDASEIRAKTCVRVEKNFYEALHYSIYTTAETDISEGSAQLIDNTEVMRTTRAYPPTCTADIPYAYSSVLISNTADVKTSVPAAAGVGKL